MKPARWPRWLFFAAVALAALALQALLWASYYRFAPKRLVGDEVRYRDLAMAIWQGHAPPADFLWPPLQGHLLAWLVGPLDGALWLAQAVQMAMLLLAALALRQIWRRVDPTPWAADVAMALFLTCPALMAFGLYLWPEPVHLLCLLGGLWLLVAHADNKWAALLAGVAVGVALLSKSLLAGFWPVLLLFFLRRPLRPHLKTAALFLLALAVVAGPATVRGWLATGKPLVADSGVFNLEVGLQDRWRSDYIEDGTGHLLRNYLDAGDTPRERIVAAQQRIDALVAPRGWRAVLAERVGVQYFRLFNVKRTLASQLPGPGCAGYLNAYTLPANWIHAVSWSTKLQYLLLLVAAGFGLALWRRANLPVLVVGLFLAYQLALFLGLHVQARFLVPMLPFLCGLAASGVVAVANARWQPVPAWRYVVASLLVAVLLVLALGGPWLDRSCA